MPSGSVASSDDASVTLGLRISMTSGIWSTVAGWISSTKSLIDGNGDGGFGCTKTASLLKIAKVEVSEMETELWVVRSFDVSLEVADRSSKGGLISSSSSGISTGSGVAGSGAAGMELSSSGSTVMVRFSKEVSSG